MAASIDALNRVEGSTDPLQDIYVRGTFRHGDEVLTDVGVRIKGEASFRTLDDKAPFKIKFDEFVATQAFRGLKRLTLNNMVEDPSFLAERLAFHFFRAVKLPAPTLQSRAGVRQRDVLRPVRQRRGRGQAVPAPLVQQRRRQPV